MKRSYIFIGVLYFIVSIILCRLPLFNYLGYEFSVSIAIIGFLAAGFSTIASLKKSYPASSLPDVLQFRDIIVSSMRMHVLLAGIPLFVITINAFIVKNCSYAEGLIFFLLIPIVTLIFSCCLGSFCFVIWRRAYLFFILFTLLFLSYPLYIGYVTPQIYSYNPVYGYFPGLSYDEILDISSNLIVFRGITIVAGILLFYLGTFFLRYGQPGSRLAGRFGSLRYLFRFTIDSIAIIAGILVLTVFWLTRVPLGFESPTSSIQRALSEIMLTPHFRIHYAPSSFSNEEIRRVGAEHEFCFEKVSAILQTSFDGKIDSYIYPDAETKRRYIGTGTTNIAKPWRKEIHLNIDSWEASVEHELVHVLAGEFGMPVIKANINTGIVEGLAMAVDEDYGNRTLDEYAAAMKQFSIIRDPGKLISPSGFMFQSSSVSYVLMGSFCKFLINRYGMIRFKQLYHGRSPAMVYGSSFDELIRDWQHYLDRIEVPADWKSHVSYYFERPSIFAKECARSIAKQNAAGWKKLGEDSSALAASIFTLSLQKSWNSEAFSGLVRSEYRAANFDTVIQLMNNRGADSNANANLLLYYGDALWNKGDTIAARRVYRNVSRIGLSDPFDELIAARLAILSDPNISGRFATYFTGRMNDSEIVKLFNEEKIKSKNSVIPYLYGKFFIRHKEYALAIAEFQIIAEPLGDDILESSKEIHLGECLFQLQKFQAARVHFWQSLNTTTNLASIRRAEDWLDRCEWYSENF